MNKIVTAILVILGLAVVVGLGVYAYKHRQSTPTAQTGDVKLPILGTMQLGQIDSGAASTSRQGSASTKVTQSTIVQNDGVTMKVSGGYTARSKHNLVNVYTGKGSYAGGVEIASKPSESTSLDMQEQALKLSPDASTIRRGTFSGKPAIFYHNKATGKDAAIILDNNRVYYADGEAISGKQTQVTIQ